MRKHEKKARKLGAPLGPHSDRRGGMPSGLAARIVRIRIERGLTQAQAAQELGVDADTWGRWELGTMPRPLYRTALRTWLQVRVEQEVPVGVLATEKEQLEDRRKELREEIATQTIEESEDDISTEVRESLKEEFEDRAKEIREEEQRRILEEAEEEIQDAIDEEFRDFTEERGRELRTEIEQRILEESEAEIAEEVEEALQEEFPGAEGE